MVTSPMRLGARFSLRTVAILVTLVCAYFGAWEATKRYGIQGGQDATAPLPFIVVQTELVERRGSRLADSYTEHWMERRAYLWLFGPELKLPFGSVTAFQAVDEFLDRERISNADPQPQSPH
jgi:hypothetical protein